MQIVGTIRIVAEFEFQKRLVFRFHAIKAVQACLLARAVLHVFV